MTANPKALKKASFLNKKFSWRFGLWVLPVAFFLVEGFASLFLWEGASTRWPLIFGAVWAVLLTGVVWALPRKAGRITFGVLYFLSLAYCAVQTGYYILFKQMMWISDFRYASEGSAFFSVLLEYPISWWACLLGLLALGGLILWRYPNRKGGWFATAISGLTVAVAVATAVTLPNAVFAERMEDQYIYAGSDYGRSSSERVAYENMFNTHRLYRICGLYQTAVKDIYANYIYPILPAYAVAQAEAVAQVDAYFDTRGEQTGNDMTGIFAGKNVVLVLMESMDDWALGYHTPTINRLMQEGINFTNFYTPMYGGVRTFNTEFCINTGSFLSTRGGYAFDYVTNHFDQSIANVLAGEGYSAKTYHYNTPQFYSRGEFIPAMGYEEYVCYEDYTVDQNELMDDCFLFTNEQVAESFFRDGQTLNYIITRSAHLNYYYYEALGAWGLRKYPEFRGMTGHQEKDCMYLKAKLVDDMFARLLQELEARGELDNTVIVGVTDHYSYGINDTDMLMRESGVDDALLLEKTPCFIWSADGPSMQVDKTLNTADLLPTVLNLLGVDAGFDYLGQDAFNENYVGYALFPNGSWISDGLAYSTTTGRTFVLEEGKVMTPEIMSRMERLVNDFVYTNNQILQTDYYRKK